MNTDCLARVYAFGVEAVSGSVGSAQERIKQLDRLPLKLLPSPLKVLKL